MAEQFNAISQRGKRVKISFKPTATNPENRVKSRAHQSFRDEANINNIIKRYNKTGVFGQSGNLRSARSPQFGDFADLPNLPETL